MLQHRTKQLALWDGSDVLSTTVVLIFALRAKFWSSDCCFLSVLRRLLCIKHPIRLVVARKVVALTSHYLARCMLSIDYVCNSLHGFI